MAQIKVIEGDITAYSVDAIVNAANNDLILGAGVAGAIRRAGGPSIQAECDRHGPIAVGDAAITSAGNLPAKYVIHAAGMSLGSGVTENSLRSCVKASLVLAEKNDVKSISFPAIGAGIGGFSLDRCAKVMKEEVENHLKAGSNLELVQFVLFGENAFFTFKRVIES